MPTRQQPRINVYTCPICKKFTVTVDVDHGVTPMFLRCRSQGGCTGMAVSAMYPRGPKPAHIPSPQWEWFRPSCSEYKSLTFDEKAHVDNGGLLIRPRTDAKPVMHADEQGEEEEVPDAD